MFGNHATSAISFRLLGRISNRKKELNSDALRSLNIAALNELLDSCVGRRREGEPTGHSHTYFSEGDTFSDVCQNYCKIKRHWWTNVSVYDIDILYLNFWDVCTIRSGNLCCIFLRFLKKSPLPPSLWECIIFVTSLPRIMNHLLWLIFFFFG